MKLNLGCGSRHMDNFVNLDVSANVGADVVHDLDIGPWPFGDASAALIVAQDVFEHLDKPILFMTECHRILEPSGRLLIKTPHWQHQDAYTDPTHKRFPTEHTFDYWIKGTVLHADHNAAYGAVDFTLQGLDIQHGAMFVRLVKA